MEIRPSSSPPIPTHSVLDKNPAATQATGATAPNARSVDPNSVVQQPTPSATVAQVTQALKSINKAMQDQARDLEFSLDPDSNRTIIKVVDQKTGEVVRQIPSTEAIQIAKALDQAQQGLLIRQKA